MPMGRRETKAVIEWRYWMDRAEEARTIAEGFRDPEARQAMLHIASDYENIAEMLLKPRRFRNTAPKRAL